MNNNPFRYTGPIISEDSISGSTFVERINILNRYFQLTQQGEYVQFVGPHRSGRTTLAIDLIDRSIPNNMMKQDIIPVLISCGSLIDADWNGFMMTIVNRLRRVINEGVPRNNCMNIRELLFSDDKYPCSFLELHLLLLDVGNLLIETKEYTHFIFLVDEIEAMPDHLVEEVLRFFRGLYGHYEKYWESPFRVAIFTTHDLSYWKLGRSSPYNISNIIKLKPFSIDELNTMLDNQHVGNVLPDIIFNEFARKRIMTESGGQPYFIQRLCHILVERYKTKKIHTEIIGKKEVFKAVLEIFEKGDDNLYYFCQDAILESNEWELCKWLIAGRRKTYAADNPIIKKLVELGIINNIEGYCHIAARLYQRQILMIYFEQQYQTIIVNFTDKEQLLLNISCLQEILLNNEIKHLIFNKMKDSIKGKTKEINFHKLVKKHTDDMEEILEAKDLLPNMEEIQAYIEYYNLGSIEDDSEILMLLSKVLVAKFIDENDKSGRTDK